MIQHKEQKIGGRPVGTAAPRSDAVKRVREALGMTQEMFSREIGLSMGTVQKLEQQNREPGTQAGKSALIRLARKAGVSIEKEVAA